MQKNSFPPKKVLKRVPKKGFQKSSGKRAENGAKKSAKKSLVTFKALRKVPKKVFFLQKVQKRAL